MHERKVQFAMLDSNKKLNQALRKYAEQELGNLKNTKGFENLKNSASAMPVQVYSRDNVPAFWMVPFISGVKSSGFAIFDMEGKLIRTGVFGTGCDNDPGMIDSSYFKRPSSAIMEEIKLKYSQYDISEPVFSYDRTPVKWAWRVILKKNGKRDVTIYILPDNWYEAINENSRATDMEG